MKESLFQDGLLLEADVSARDTMLRVKQFFGDEPVPLILADPPYGSVLTEKWDKVGSGKAAEDAFVAWMLDWTNLWSELLADGGAMYCWGGVGVPGMRPFYGFMNRVERETDLTIANHITWKKKRAYGVSHNYLFTREELAYLTKGDPKKPRCFHIPLTDKVRGYKGYNKKYAAKSDMLRRTNVWEEDGLPSSLDGDEYRMADVWDETEILRGKRHTCEKVARVNEIPIEVHTNPGDGVVDLFSGSGSLSEAARRLGRAWVAVEKDSEMCAKIANNMR